MKNMLFMMVLFCVSSLAGQARNVNANSFDDSLRSEADKLLTEWMDAFLAYQYTCSDSALDRINFNFKKHTIITSQNF